MSQTNLLNNNANYSWNFLNYPIHTISASTDNSSQNIAVLLIHGFGASTDHCLLYTSPSPRDIRRSRMPSSA